MRVFTDRGALVAHQQTRHEDLRALELLAVLDPELGDLSLMDLNTELMRFWLSENASRVQAALPFELNLGLSQWFSLLQVNGGKVRAPILDLYLESTRAIARVEGRPRLRDLLLDGSVPSPDAVLADSGAPRILGASAVLFVDYFLSPKSKAKADTRDLLPTYLAALDAAARTVRERRAAGVDAESFRARLQREREEALRTAFDATFGEWTERDWERFDRAFYGAYRLR